MQHTLNTKQTESTQKKAVKSEFKFPKIGMRSVKTALSALLCAILYALVKRNPTFACIGAIFGMDNTLPSSLRTGGNRLIGTAIGGLVGIGMFSLSLVLPYPHIARMVLLAVGIIVLIYSSQLLRIPGAIQAGSVVLCIIMFNTAEDQYISYALNRMFDTAVGVSMSILINWIHIKKRSGTSNSFKPEDREDIYNE